MSNRALGIVAIVLLAWGVVHTSRNEFRPRVVVSSPGFDEAKISAALDRVDAHLDDVDFDVDVDGDSVYVGLDGARRISREERDRIREEIRSEIERIKSDVRGVRVEWDDECENFRSQRHRLREQWRRELHGNRDHVRNQMRAFRDEMRANRHQIRDQAHQVRDEIRESVRRSIREQRDRSDWF
jgi:hypothetical protein